MQFSEQWLRQWVNPAINTQQLAHALTMAGLEISSVEPACGNLSKVKVGEIQTVEAHPDSDRLFITQVMVDQAKPITVVTNVAGLQPNAKVAVATVGALMPDGLEIKQADLRGVTSQGMFCSLHTLGLSDEDEGIHHFPVDTKVGAEVAVAMNLQGDHIFELEITPNRGDCLSILGVAREVAVVTESELTEQANSSINATCQTEFPISIQIPELCPSYVGRVIENVDLSCPSPLWLTERLRRSGIRSINAVVDVTNYVMIELGQPMHAFDLKTLHDGIVVRAAEPGEHLTLLDGKTITCQPGQCLISDSQKPLALAGVMGGEDSGVSDNTKHLFLESAYFQPVHIAANARHFGLSTDSSYRFERGVDPLLQQRAIERATELLLAIVGGQAGPIINKVSPDHLPQKQAISLNKQRIPGLLGFDIDDQQVETILTKLGMDVKATEAGWQVMPPSYRHDVEIEVDFIEECARIYGYDKIPTLPLVEPLATTVAKEQVVPLREFKNRLNGRGYHEVITYSFVDSEVQALLDPEQPSIALANPISKDLNVMRSNLWSGLIKVLQFNLNRQQKRCRLFETGLRFTLEDDRIYQEPVISGLVVGNAEPDAWGLKSRPVDFFDIKSDVCALFDNQDARLNFTRSEHQALHPGQQAYVCLDDQVVGIVGQCHPVINERLKITQPIFVFECQLSALEKRQLPQFTPLSKFPVVKRDIGLVVDKNVTAQQILEVIVDKKPSICIEQSIFDVYAGEGLGENEKSIAISLIFQHLSHTLKESEVNECTQALVNALTDAVGAKLRDW